VEVVSTGVRWLLVPLAREDSVRNIRPDLPHIQRVAEAASADGLIAFHAARASAKLEVRLRTFAPGQGISEDPVCGSGNGAVGAYVFRHQLLGAADPLMYQASQGTELGRAGHACVEVHSSGATIHVRVGGAACLVAVGEMFLTAGASARLDFTPKASVLAAPVQQSRREMR
jgi:PhzF family phenazine biosynthesis protein